MVLIVVAALLPLHVALAKEIVQVTISGPGLDNPIKLTAADDLAVFRELRYDEGMIALPPTDPNGPYFEIRTSVGVNDQIVATDVGHYYFTADHSYMYFADVEGGWSDAERTWFRLSAESDRALRAFLADRGAVVERRQQTNDWLLPLWNMILALFG
ncbi:MAG: hypothetical protein HZC41_12285 [Chloroflexi bacterium]|nr:hypothetical protein [Chloroflexota bacterium]